MKKGVVISCKDVSKKFHGQKVLDEISVDFMRGEIFGIIGMSGSGKTTLLNSLIGFYQTDGGEITYNNEGKMINLEDHPYMLRQLIGFAPQQPSVYPKLSALENLHYFGVLYKLSNDVIRTNTDQLLQLTQLTDHRKKQAWQLSFGMQKRLGISCALIHKPKVLILDEPTADLDPILRSEIWELVKKINQNGTTVIIASHLLDEVESICHRVGIIHNGTLEKVGPVASLKQLINQDHQVMVQIVSHKYPLLLKRLKGKTSLKITSMENVGDKLIIKTKCSEKVMGEILHQVSRMHDKITTIQITSPSLEDVFKSVYKGKK